MELDLEICRTIAIRYGLPLQFVFKEFCLMDVMSQISSIAIQKHSKLVLKGGTALNKVYLQKMQRFSEDADFDLVSNNSGQYLYEFSRKLASEINGYEISDLRRVRSTIQFYCVYETPLGGKDHVRIDMASKKLLTAKPLENNTIISEFTHSSVSGMPIYSIEDLTARKMHALADRAEGKDLYDVHMALPMCSKKVLKTAIELMLKSEEEEGTADSFMQRLIVHLKKSDPKKMRNITNPFIPAASRPKSWEELKNNLLAILEDLQNNF